MLTIAESFREKFYAEERRVSHGVTVQLKKRKLHSSVTSAVAEDEGESTIFLFFLGPMAARAVRLASLCLI